MEGRRRPTYHLLWIARRPAMQGQIPKIGAGFTCLTEFAVAAGGDAPAELPESSIFSLTFGLEKDLNRSDCSRFGLAGLLTGFFVASPLEEGRSVGLTVLVPALLTSGVLLLAFDSILAAGTEVDTIPGRRPLLRYETLCVR